MKILFCVYSKWEFKRCALNARIEHDENLKSNICKKELIMFPFVVGHSEYPFGCVVPS